ncbi:MAG TPA: hypothetical protein VFX70_19490 [Mycobacteriales bacterium]|nr:hypothetical protein [Mycobacteriales bacterium]
MLFPYVWLRSTGFPYTWLEELALPAEGVRDADTFQRQMERIRRTVVELLDQPLAVEALFLSNPEAVRRLDSLAGADLARPNVRTRQRLRLAWSYLQRFCAKNETVSFFGPLAWGQVNPAAEHALAGTVPDPELGWLRRRRVSFEHWVIDELCARIGEAGPDVLPLRLNHACDLDGTTLSFPLGRRTALPVPAADLVRAIGDGTVEERGEPAPAAVRRLVSAGVLHRELTVAPGTGEPLRDLRAALPERSPAGTGGFDPVALLSTLEGLRTGFEAGDYRQRRAVQATLLSTLSEAGIDTRRPTGTFYAGRSPVYEDCERNFRFEIGGPLVGALETGLQPLLRLYRLVAECAASLLHRHYAAVLTGLGPAGGGTADFVSFLNAARSPATIQVRRRIIRDLGETLRSSWAAICPDPDVDEVDLDEDRLALIAATLRASYPDHGRFSGTLGVGVVSPDVMIAAPHPAAVRAGELRVVLGEVHPCVLTALQPVALPFLGDRDEALRRADALLEPGRVLLATTSRAYHRSQIAWPVTPNLYEVELPGATSRCPRERRIPAGRGRVEVRQGMVHFVDRATRRAEDMVTLLSSDLHQVMFALARDVLGGELCQRLTHRDVLVKRRSWPLAPADIPAAARPAEVYEDYRSLRTWARARGLPRRGFVTTDTEAKPVFLDWDNPLAVDSFARMARQAARIRLTEMVPGPDDLWFTDAGGVHTAELRMSFVV